MLYLRLRVAIISFFLLISLSSPSASSSIAFSTTTSLPSATPTAFGNYLANGIAVNTHFDRNNKSGSDFQDYLFSLFTSPWTFSVDVFFSADGTSSTSTISISGPAHEVPDSTPSVVAADNQTTYWDVCFMYLPDLLNNYDQSHPNGADGTAMFNGSFMNTVGLDCSNGIGDSLDPLLFNNFTTACSGTNGTGNTLSLQVPENCSRLVGDTSNGNITVYTTPIVIGQTPFFVRTDTYTTGIKDSLVTAKQRSFPILWVERLRTGEVSLDNSVSLRALNGSAGAAPATPSTPTTPKKGAAVGAYGDLGFVWVLEVAMAGMAAMILW